MELCKGFLKIHHEQRFGFFLPLEFTVLSDRVLAASAEQHGKCLDIAPLCFFSTFFFFKAKSKTGHFVWFQDASGVGFCVVVLPHHFLKVYMARGTIPVLNCICCI